MCGIAGIYNYRTGRPADPLVLKIMADAMEHRGPDDAGVYSKGPIGFSHRRLSIIDLASGHQPMANSDRSVVITYNGEVYNYLDLRRLLEACGHCFSTSSDTEVLLHAYAAYGTEMVNRLNGMFAFGLWDDRNHTLLLARDRFGIKPLYYAETAEGIVFASEIKALLASGLVTAAVEDEALYRYMRLGFVSGEGTMFRGIKKLMPGYHLVCQDSGFRIHRYWDMHFSERQGVEEEEWCEQLLVKLKESVRLTLQSDVPVGVFLSGGIDSSMVVALAAAITQKPVQTFSVAYDMGPSYDEFSYARMVAKQFCTQHHELYVTPREFCEFIPQFVRCFEEPVTEAAAISLFFLSKLAREHVKVMLCGEGADEMLAGYPVYRRMELIELSTQVLGGWASKTVTPILKRLCVNSKLEKYFNLSKLPVSNRYCGAHLYDPKHAARLMCQEFLREAAVSNFEKELCALYEATPAQNYLNQMLYVDTKWWLPDDLLIKADRMSMANSIELRVPFLEHNFVEFVTTIPPRLKLKGSITKYIQKRSAERILPTEIVSRGKMGFPTPIRHILRTEMGAYVRDLLLSSRCAARGYFDMRQVEALIREFETNPKSDALGIWQLVVLEEWCRTFIDRANSIQEHLRNH
jgi:asparagine synthase (glutamine-hydrolysing)